MKAFVYNGLGQSGIEERPKPELRAPGDAIVKMSKTTICGTDLRILKGDVATCEPGRILGHEGVGVIDTLGVGVSNFYVGDRVLISSITACCKCDHCRRGMFSHCSTGGWILGNKIDGTQAEFVRIPHADTSLYPMVEGYDQDAMVMLSELLPTGFECGVLNGKVVPGSTVAIVGAGPVGLAALLTAQFYSPAQIIVIDVDDNRLAAAKRLGATHALNSNNIDVVETARVLTGVYGADTVIEAVGLPVAFQLCQEIVGPGGVIANIGVHGKKADLHLESLWSRNVTITTRLVDTISTPMLLKAVKAKTLSPAELITHHFKMSEIVLAYDTFQHALETKALKVLVEF